MSATLQIQSIAATLDAYHQQLVTLSDALGALREASDQIRSQLEQDRAALAAYAMEAHPIATTLPTVAIAVATVAATTLGGDLPSEAVREAEIEPTAMPEVEDGTVAVELAAAEGDEVRATLAMTAEVEEVAEADGDQEPGAFSQDVPITDVNVDSDVGPLEPAPLEPALNLEPAAADAADTATPDASPAALQEGAVGEPPAAADSDGDKAESNVVALDTERGKRRRLVPSRRMAVAIVASLIVTVSAGLGIHEMMQGDLGQRLVDLATCDGDMLSADRNCSLLAWLML